MGSHYDGTAAQVRALSAFINLMRAGDALARRTERALDRAGLTASQFGVLEALLHLGPLNQGELAGKLLRSYGSVTSVVAGLERRKLVVRRRGGQDRRFVRASLTAKGRAIISKIFPAHAALVTRGFSVLSDDEQERLRELCRKLGRAASAD